MLVQTPPCALPLLQSILGAIVYALWSPWRAYLCASGRVVPCVYLALSSGVGRINTCRSRDVEYLPKVIPNPDDGQRTQRALYRRYARKHSRAVCAPLSRTTVNGPECAVVCKFPTLPVDSNTAESHRVSLHYSRTD